MIRLMREGRPCYYLPDIDPGDKTPHEFVPFFGIAAATVTAMSRLARIAGAAVVPCIAREVGWGRYEIEFLPPMENIPSDDALADLRRLNALIEAEVRKTPAQYLWIHRRFKTRPPGEKSFYD
jgi:KDO2-lipid IV(A) lauroyltransferase